MSLGVEFFVEAEASVKKTKEVKFLRAEAEEEALPLFQIYPKGGEYGW